MEEDKKHFFEEPIISRYDDQQNGWQDGALTGCTAITGEHISGRTSTPVTIDFSGRSSEALHNDRGMHIALVLPKDLPIILGRRKTCLGRDGRYFVVYKVMGPSSSTNLTIYLAAAHITTIHGLDKLPAAY